MDPMMEQGLTESVDPELKQLSDGVSDYIHGPAREQIAQSLAQPEGPIEDTIAAVSYQILTQVGEQIHGEGQVVTFDLMLPLATETIDYLIEVAAAVGSMPDEQADQQAVNEVREKSLIKLVQIHIGAVQDDPEQKAEAEQMLAEFMQDGTYDEGMSYVQEKAAQEGATPEQIQAMGQQMTQPRQNQLTGAVQQGLMGGAA